MGEDSAKLLADLQAHNPTAHAAMMAQLQTGRKFELVKRRERIAPRPMVSSQVMRLDVCLPLETKSEMNTRDWQAQMRRKGQQRRAVDLFFSSLKIPPLPVTIRFIRYGVRLLDEKENLRTAFKFIADSIADCYGVDDADKRYEWEYAQEIRQEIGIRIEIAHRES